MLNPYAEEVWKYLDIADLEEPYAIQISNFGRIRSFRVSKVRPKILKGSWISGYNVLVLKLKSGKSTTFYIHKLVAQHFLPAPDDTKTYIIHRDFNRSNNHFGNLEWVDKEANYLHRLNDVEYNSKKIRNSKLTETQVIAIKKMLQRGALRPYRIAQQFGISQTHLLRIKNGESWGHIKV